MQFYKHVLYMYVHQIKSSDNVRKVHYYRKYYMYLQKKKLFWQVTPCPTFVWYDLFSILFSYYLRLTATMKMGQSVKSSRCISSNIHLTHISPLIVHPLPVFSVIILEYSRQFRVFVHSDFYTFRSHKIGLKSYNHLS